MKTAIRLLQDRLMQGVGRFRGAQKPKRWVGLDLGSQSLKLVEMEQTATGLRLVKSLIQELPVSADGQPIDRSGWPHHLSAAQGAGPNPGPAPHVGRDSQVVGWLQTALQEVDTRDVHVSISGSDVAIRRVHVPLMPKQELPEAVKWQVKDQVAFPIQDAVLDFEVVGEVWDKDIRKQDVLVAVASRPRVQGLIALVERAGGRVVSVSPAPCAVWRCVTTLMPDITQGSVAVIELGASATDVSVAKDGHLRLVRTLAVGSASMTQVLIGRVGSERGEIAIDASKAEGLKRRYGVVTDAGERTTAEGIPFFHLASLMRPVLESLLTELSRVCDFYKAQMEETGVSRVLLCGGGANLKSLAPFLAEGLGVAVEIFNPLIRITDRVQPLEPEQIADGGPRLAAAMGLALDRGQGLSLLSIGDGQRPNLFAVSRRVVAMAAQCVGAAALILYLGLHLYAGILQWRIRGQQTRWATVEPAYTQYMKVTSARKTLEGTIAQIQQFLAQQPVWGGIFKELGTLIPSSLELDELTVTTDRREGSSALQIRVKGRVVAGASAQGSLSQFVEAMERSPFFQQVELTGSELHSGDTGTTRFELKGVLE